MKLFVERKLSNLLHVIFAYRASETHNQQKHICDYNTDMALRQYEFNSLRIKDNKYWKNLFAGKVARGNDSIHNRKLKIIINDFFLKFL